MARWALTNSEAGWITAIFYGAYICAVPIRSLKTLAPLKSAGAPWVIKAQDLEGFARGKRQKPSLTPDATQQVFDFQ